MRSTGQPVQPVVLRNARLGDGRVVDLVVRGPRIDAVTLGAAAPPGVQAVELGQRLVVPGFVDAHIHVDKALLAERVVYEDAFAARRAASARLKASFTVEDIMGRARKVVEAASRRGTTVMRANADVDPVVGLKGVEALLGLRSEMAHLVDLQVVAFAQDGIADGKTPDLLRAAAGLGVDALGGHTLIDPDGRAHVDAMFRLANATGLPLEFHVDESGDPKDFLFPYVAQQTTACGMRGRVNAIHCCSLANVPDDVAREAITEAGTAGLAVTVAPYAISPQRKLTRVADLLAAGIPVAIGTDNYRDVFQPLGNADPICSALLLAAANRLLTPAMMDAILLMLTNMGRACVGMPHTGGLASGAPADLVVLDALDFPTALKEVLPRYLVVKGGEIRYGGRADRRTEGDRPFSVSAPP